MVNFQFYDPSDIFQDNTHHKGMAGEKNVALATSFFHSRNHSEEHQCNFLTHARSKKFDRNAGAIQLYQKNSIDIYQISEQLNNKEYHYISYGNKYFKKYNKYENDLKANSYGHSERILMRDILDDLISANHPDKHDILRPSDDLNCKSSDAKDKEYEVLKFLTNYPENYKKYLESNNIIVKMWSERPACTEESNDGELAGGNCESFMDKICPKDSQFGYIVKDYTRSDNLGTKVQDAFTVFKNAYQEYLNLSNDDIGVIGE